MKKKDRYQLLSYARNQYNEIFNLNLQFKYLSKKELYDLVDAHKNSSMCEWSYCCYGLYQNCWQEPIEDGIWGMTQEQVNKIIRNIIDKTAKACCKDNRTLYCKNEYGVHVIIVARDIMKTDFLFTFR